MQSILQYRRIRAQLEAQMTQDPEQFRNDHCSDMQDAEKVRTNLSSSSTRAMAMGDQQSLATHSLEGPTSNIDTVIFFTHGLDRLSRDEG